MNIDNFDISEDYFIWDETDNVLRIGAIRTKIRLHLQPTFLFSRCLRISYFREDSLNPGNARYHNRRTSCFSSDSDRIQQVADVRPRARILDISVAGRSLSTKSTRGAHIYMFCTRFRTPQSDTRPDTTSTGMFCVEPYDRHDGDYVRFYLYHTNAVVHRFEQITCQNSDNPTPINVGNRLKMIRNILVSHKRLVKSIFLFVKLAHHLSSHLF